MEQVKYGKIINTNISALKLKECVDLIDHWIMEKHNDYICVCNTHSLVTASNDKNFNKILENAGLCVPDGVPLVWALRLYGYKEQDRVDGPNLMLRLCELSEKKKLKIFLYGSTQKTLEKLEDNLMSQFNSIDLVGAFSPPFGQLSEKERQTIIDRINDCNPDIIFVGLGCPKQEQWMYENRNDVKGIMLGVGAAFDFIAGNIKRPPIIFQRLGLEWLFRLLSEPRRLWKRYAYNNPVFIFRFLKTYKKNKEYARNLFRGI